MKKRLMLVGALALGAGLLLVAWRSGRAPWPRVSPRPAPAAKRDPRGLDKDGRTDAETRAVRLALRALPAGTRSAEDEDGLDSDARRDLENLYADYHPYFVRGDLDGDGRLDFAQAFAVRRNGALWFDVAVFFGQDGGTFRDPVFVEKAITLAPGDLSIERSLLILTPDLSQDDARRWRYEPSEHRFVDADAHPPVEAPDADARDETPDERPRARA